MSERIEWSDARHGIAILTPDDTTTFDEYGQAMEPGNYGIYLPGAVTEGTLEEVRDALIKALSRVAVLQARRDAAAIVAAALQEA